jgi:transposase-like protein
MRTPAHQLADIRCDGRLDDIVSEWLAGGVSYRAISKLLAADHGIDVSDETLRRWYPKAAAA